MTTKPPPGKKGRTWKKPSGLLRDMRFVYGASEPIEGDSTQGRRECRAWLKDDRKGFLGKMSDLERALQASGDRSKAAAVAAGLGVKPAAEMDEGTERVMELIQRLLGEWKNGV